MFFTVLRQVDRAVLIFVRATLFTKFPKRFVFTYLSGNLYRLCSFVKRRLRTFARLGSLRFPVLIERVPRRMHPSCPEYPPTKCSGAVGSPFFATSVNSSLTVPSLLGRLSFFCLFGWLPSVAWPSMCSLASSVVGPASVAPQSSPLSFVYSGSVESSPMPS